MPDGVRRARVSGLPTAGSDQGFRVGAGPAPSG